MDKAGEKAMNMEQKLRVAEMIWNAARHQYWRYKGQFIEKETAYNITL